MTTAPIIPLPLPAELADWHGTASQLADQCNALLAAAGLPEDDGAANERLVRHYVQVGVLDPPERAGREALFDVRQVLEFLAARHLIKDGWPLAKIAELIRSSDRTALGVLDSRPRPRTRAQDVVSALRSRRSGKWAAQARPVHAMVAERARPSAPGDFATAPRKPTLSMAAEISTRRTALRENLLALGNEQGAPDRVRMVQIALAPWCTVYVDTAQLKHMPEDTPALLGTALTQALQEERLQRGE
jgi:DNA-binding transcriptional MerR regulator